MKRKIAFKKIIIVLLFIFLCQPISVLAQSKDLVEPDAKPKTELKQEQPIVNPEEAKILPAPDQLPVIEAPKQNVLKLEIPPISDLATSSINISNIILDPAAQPTNNNAAEIDQVDPGLEPAITWLLGQQSTSTGFWTDDKGLVWRETLEAVLALQSYNRLSWHQQYDLAHKIQNVEIYDNNIDWLARKASLLAALGYSDKTALDTLVSYQNSDGGWGLYPKYASDVITTAVVLQALTLANYQQTNLPQPLQSQIGAVWYLITKQTANGGLAYAGETASSLNPTLWALAVLNSYSSWTLANGPTQYNVGTVINSALTWLRNQQQANGSWDNSVWTTAWSYYLLQNYNSSVTNPTGAKNYLLAARVANGSFQNKVYETLMSLRALGFMPDLAVTEVAPPSYLVDGQNQVVTTTITNLGKITNSQPFTINYYVNNQLVWSGSISNSQQYSIAPGGKFFIGLNFGPTYFDNYNLSDLRVEVVPTAQPYELNQNNNSWSWNRWQPRWSGPNLPWFGMATGRQAGYLSLQWLPVTGISGYRLDYGSASTSLTGHLALSAAWTSASLSGLPVNTPFYFRLVALNAQSQRGDAGAPQLAVARSNPGSYVGSISGLTLNGLSQTTSAVSLTTNLFGYDNNLTTGLSGANGTYQWTGVYPGYYLITASHPSYGQTQIPIRVNDNQAVANVNVQLPLPYPTGELGHLEEGGP